MTPSVLRKRHRRNCWRKRRLTMEDAAHEFGLVLNGRCRQKPGRDPLGLYVCLACGWVHWGSPKTISRSSTRRAGG